MEHGFPQGEGRRRVLASLALVAVVGLFFWPLVGASFLAVPDDVATSDLNAYHLPGRAHLAQALGQGRFPTWVDGAYGGFPVAAAMEFGYFYPFNLLLFGGLPLLWAWNLRMLSPFVVTGLGMLFLGRRLGLNWGGTLLACLSYVFSGPFIMHLRLPNMVDAACWLPLLLWALETFLQTGRRGWAAVLAGLFALQILAGHPQISYISGLTLLLHFLLRRTVSDEPRRWSAIGARVFRWSGTAWLGLFLVLALSMGAVQLLPTWELKEMSLRGGEGVSQAFAQAYAYPTGDALTFLWPYAHGDAGTRSYGRGIHWENYGYGGVAPFLLALVAAVWLVRRDARVRRLLLLGAFAYLLVLGPATPLFGLLFRILPGMGMFRFPQRWLFVVDLAMALLAGLCWTRLCARWSSEGVASTELANDRPRDLRTSRRLVGATVLLLVGTLGDLAWFQRRQVPVARADAWLKTPATARRILAEGRGDRVYTVGAVETHVRAYREASGWEGSLAPYLSQLDFLQCNTGLLHGLATSDGYFNLVPRYLAEVFGHVGQEQGLIRKRIYGGPGGPAAWGKDAVTLRLLGMWNTGWILSAWPQKEGLLEAMGRIGAPFLYRNPLVLPRARTVGGHSVMESDEATLARLEAADFDPRRELLLCAPLPKELRQSRLAPEGFAGTARITRDEGESLDVDAKLSHPGFLVLADTWYPGWTATVDGRPRPVLRAYGCARALALDAGAHRIRFRFRSASLERGLRISLLSFLVWFALLAWALRRGT